MRIRNVFIGMSQMKTKRVIAPFLGAVCFFSAVALYAAPGEISKIPLTAGVGVKPNLLFVIDDSGSMDNEVLVRQSAAEIYTFNADAKDGTNHHRGNLDMTPDHPREYLELCLGYNVLAYNPDPEVTYEPWSGQPQADPSQPKSFATGKSTANVIVAPGELRYLRAVDGTYTDDNDRGSVDVWGDYPNGEAVLDLRESAEGGKADEVGYVPWTDTNGDGLFQVEECGGDQVFSNGRLEDVSYDHDGDGVEDNIPTGFVSYSSMNPEEKQNFANWYTYHRKRRFAAIKPLTDIVNENDGLRVGLATINKALPYATQVDDLADANHKQELLNKLYQLGGTEATPLRRPLDNAGRYFTGDPNLPVDQDFVGPNGGEPSPILSIEEGGECQQNYTLLFTDGRSNEGRAVTYPDLGHIQNEDGGPCNESECYNGGVYGYEDSWEDTLGDIAMYYYSIDMKDQYEDKVSSKADPFGNDAQHMVTYTVAFGATGEIKNYDPSLDIRTLDDDYFDWPNLDQLSGNDSLWEGERAESIDDLLHAAVNGRGKFLSAAEPSTLKSGLEEIVGDVLNASSGSASGVSFNANSTDAGSVAYQASYDGTTWGGNLQALDFSQGGPVLVCEVDPSKSCDAADADTDAACPSACVYDSLFDADEILNTRVAASVIDDNSQEIGGQSTRNIFTYNGQVTVDFQFPADVMNLDLNKEISQEQVNDLLKNAPADDAQNQNYGLQIVQYLRGDNRFLLDDTRYPFRNRLGDTLGAIVHSSPQYVGPPSANYANFIESNLNPYRTFVEDNEDRAPVVYVGANDGMLHAFRAAYKLEEDTSTGEINSVLDPIGGEELFAYIPKLVFSEEDQAGLHWLADPTYSLQPYVDASPTIQDAFYDGDWHTILTGGLGAGGKGIYVLDVTDPEAIASGLETNPVMVEFSHENLGYTYSRPQIAKLNNDKWGVIFGNGYLNTGTGQSSLFILYLDAEPDANGDFREGEDYEEITTGKGSVTDGSDCLAAGDDCNGMSSATLVDLNGDGTVDRVYAGDLHGHLWGFDLSDDDENNWGVAHTVSTDKRPLFSACIDDDCTSPAKRQPITAAPAVTGHATEGGFATRPNTFVMFGTGQFLVESDLDVTTNTQSFYGVWDAGIGGVERANMVSRVFTDVPVDSAAVDPETYRSLPEIDPDTNAVDYDANLTTGKFGWYIDFPSAGERSLVSPLVVGDVVLFSSYIPSGGICGVDGSGYIMAAEIFSGGLPDFAVFNNQNDQSAVAATGGEGMFVINPANGDLTIPGGDGTIEGIDAAYTKDKLSRRVNWSIIR